jgi:uncharacterized membrane protein
MTDLRSGVGRNVTLDIALVTGYALVATLLIVTEAISGATRVAVAAPLVGFLPGYALLSTLVPATDGGEGGSVTTSRLQSPGLAWFERCSLSVAASLGLLPILAIALSTLGYPLTSDFVALTLFAVVSVCAFAGLVRRLWLTDRKPYAPPFDRWHREVRAGVIDTDGVDTVLNVALALAVLLAMSGLAYGLAAPDRGESYTEAALLTQENDSLIAGGYTTAVSPGEPVPLTLSVENQEGEPIEYTAVVVVERVRTDGESVDVLEREEIARHSLSISDGATRTQDLNATPDIIGDRLRLSVFLFQGDVPDTPTAANADERLFLWIDVQPSGGDASSLTGVGP